MNKSQKRPPAQKRQELPTAASPIEAVVRENQSEDLVPLVEAHEEERLAKALAGEEAKSGEQEAPQTKGDSTADGPAHEDKLAEKPAEQPAKDTIKSGEMAEDRATEEAKEKALEEATPGGEQSDEGATQLPSETCQVFPLDVEVAGGWYDDPDFLTLRRDEGLAGLPAVRVTPSSLSKVVSEAKKLGKKANELNKTGAHQRHLAVIARWYEGDRWLAIYEFLVAQGRRPEWVPLYEGAGLTAKQISRATRLRRAFAKVEDLKIIATLEEAEALATNILNNKKPKQSAPAKGKMQDTGAGADNSLVASTTGDMPDTGTGQVAPDEGKAEEKKADIKKPRKRRSKGTAGISGASSDEGATLPPDPAEALEGKSNLQYSPSNLLDMGVQMYERGLGRAALNNQPIGLEVTLDDLATIASAVTNKKVRGIDKEDAEALKSAQESLTMLFDFVEGPARLLNPIWLLEVAASWVSLAADETMRLKWDDPRTQCDVDKAIDSLNGNLNILKKRRAEDQV